MLKQNNLISLPISICIGGFIAIISNLIFPEIVIGFLSISNILRP